MLELKELAQFLTDGLNEFGQSRDYKFLVYAEIGKSQPNTICGVLKTSEPTITPINGIKNIKYNSVVEFAVPSPTANFNLINVEKIIGEFIEYYNGQEIAFNKGSDNGKGVVTFTFTRAKDYKMDYAVGESIPITFGVMVNYTVDMVTSATKHWEIREINGQWLEIPFLSESVLLEKGGKTNNISDALYQQTLLTSQIKHYRFEIPYETNDALCSMLQKDILQGDFGKKYELKYYDGVSFLQNDPFKTFVSIFSTGDSGSVRPDTAKLTVTFTDVDNGQNSIYYEMALVDDPFDTLSDNTQYFNSQQEQIDYFDELIAVGADYDEIPAPNLNSLNITNQVYLNTRKYDVFDLINKNHAIIKASYRDNSKTYYFHYKINSGDIGANGQVSFNLTLNTIQTYLFNPDLDIQGTFVEKSHLDRWIDNGDGTVTFNGKADSKLFEREELKEVAKRLVSRNQLVFDTDDLNLPNSGLSTFTIFDSFELQYPLVWVYIFLDGQYGFSGNDITYNFYNFGKEESDIIQEGLDRMWCDNVVTSTAVLAYPLGSVVLGQAKYGSLPTSPYIKIECDTDAFDEFIFANSTIFSHIKAIKLSIKPPINVNELDYTGRITIDYFEDNVNKAFMGGFDVNTDTAIGRAGTKFVLTSKCLSTQTQKALIYLTQDNLTPFTMKLSEAYDYKVVPQITFEKSDLTNPTTLKNKKYNPKLNASDYKDFVITIAGSQYPLDFQKINNSNPKFSYLEPLTVDTTRAIIRYVSNDDESVYSEAYSKSYNGMIYTNDVSLPLSNDAYNNYLANNKNAYLSFQNQQNLAGTQYATRTLNTILNTIKNPINGINNTQQTLMDGISTSVNLAYNQTQFNLSMDNMKSAPLSILNGNGSALFANAVDKYGIYLEVYEGLDTELEMANDIMFRDGYNYNRFDDLRSQLNIRRYFNYVKAVIGSLSGIPMSEESRKDFKQRFASGLRFWNKNEQNKFVIDYTKENYENRLV